MPQRLTNHHRAMRLYREQLAEIAADATLPELQRLWRDLHVRLRRLDRQRPDLGKRRLMKADFQPANLWDVFMERLNARLVEALNDGLINLAQMEAAFLEDRMGEALSFDPADLARAAMEGLGERIKDIANLTRKEVGRRIVRWYNTPGSTLKDAIDAVEPWFSRDRAETIARTEITRLNSIVQEGTAAAAGIDEWYWGTRNDQTVCLRDKKWMVGPDGLKYRGCRELHGKHFKIGQTMPPAHPRCRCDPILVVPPRKPRTVEGPVHE